MSLNNGEEEGDGCQSELDLEPELFLCVVHMYHTVSSLVPRPSITANAVEGLVKLLCRMTSGGMALPVNCTPPDVT